MPSVEKRNKTFLNVDNYIMRSEQHSEKRAMLGKNEKMAGDLFSTNAQSDSPAAKSSCFWKRKQAVLFFVHSDCLLQYVFWSHV